MDYDNNSHIISILEDKNKKLQKEFKTNKENSHIIV